MYAWHEPSIVCCLFVVCRARTVPYLYFVRDAEGNLGLVTGTSCMEEENLTYRKCCTTRSHLGSGFWRIARHRCRPSVAASRCSYPFGATFTKQCLYSNFLSEGTRAALLCLARDRRLEPGKGRTVATTQHFGRATAISLRRTATPETSENVHSADRSSIGEILATIAMDVMALRGLSDASLRLRACPLHRSWLLHR